MRIPELVIFEDQHHAVVSVRVFRRKPVYCGEHGSDDLVCGVDWPH